MAAFEDFFLTHLGPKFLHVLYRSFIEDMHGIAWVAISNSKLIGFAVGTRAPEGFFSRRIRKQGLAFLFAAIPALLRRPFLVSRRLAAAVRYRGERPKGLDGAWLLSSIAVHPNAQGTGTGRQLLSEFVDCASDEQAGSVYLLTDAVDNEQVERLYAAAEFSVHSQLSRGRNRLMNVYVRRIDT